MVFLKILKIMENILRALLAIVSGGEKLIFVFISICPKLGRRLYDYRVIDIVNSNGTLPTMLLKNMEFYI